MKTMQLPKLSAPKPKYNYAYHHTSDSDCPNILKQQFNPPAPNQVWVSDITYIRVQSAFCYVCVIIDLYARQVISYLTSKKINSGLVIDTLHSALKYRNYPKGVLFHSDRGVQYTCSAFRNELLNVGFIQSFSAKGHPYDNAVSEAFFKFLKKEETNRRTYNSIQELNLSLFEYVNFYNTQRPHSSNDYLTPQQKEDAFFNI